MLGPSRLTALALTALVGLAVATSIPKPNKKPINDYLNNPEEPLDDCAKCEAPTCDMKSYIYQTPMSQDDYEDKDGKDKIMYFARGIAVKFGPTPDLGIYGRIESKARYDTVVEIETMDATAVDNKGGKGKIQKRVDGLATYKVPGGKEIKPARYLIPSMTACKFNMYPLGFDKAKGGKITVFAKVPEVE